MDNKQKTKTEKQAAIADDDAQNVAEVINVSDGEVEKLAQEMEDYKSKYMRAIADYQNLEKRSREERIEWIKSAGKNILLKMLPVLDTLMLASKHSQDQNLLVSIAQFLDALKEEGVTRIETKGKKFDPMLMEAIQAVEGEEGKIVEEIRVGFMLHDKLLRPAEVTVGKKEQN